MENDENMVQEHNVETGEIIRRKATPEELADRATFFDKHWIGDMKE